MSPTARPTAAIIAAGIAGLACARVLQAAATVDIGAQFFSVRDEAFRRETEVWLKAGLVAP